jgi:hypothetical protein
MTIKDKLIELQKMTSSALNEYLLTKKTNPYYSSAVLSKRLQYTTALNEYHNYLFSTEVDDYIKKSRHNGNDVYCTYHDISTR